jgi:hypothetical protein
MPNTETVTEMARMITRLAGQLSHSVYTLRAVNMDRLADSIESAQAGILEAAEAIPKIEMGHLREDFQHHEQMMGSWLKFALTCDVVPKAQQS